MMITAPAHIEEHTQLMHMISKTVDGLVLTGGYVVITISIDGRPMIGSNLDGGVGGRERRFRNPAVS